MDALRQSLQHTAGGCSSVISSVLLRPGVTPDAYTRCQSLVASDVEALCLSLVGGSSAAQLPRPGADGSSSATAAAAGGSGGGKLLSSLMRPMRLFGGGSGGSEAAPADDSSSALSEAVQQQLQAAFPLSPAVTDSHLHPITDICMVFGDDKLPPYLRRLEYSVTGMYPADLNTGASPYNQVWLAVSRAPGPPPITAVTLVDTLKGECLPPNFTQVVHFFAKEVQGKRGQGKRATMRTTSASNPSGEAEVMLAFARGHGAPIIDLGIVFPNGALSLNNVAAALLPTALRGSHKDSGALALAPPRPSPAGGPWGTLAAAEAAASAAASASQGGAAGMLHGMTHAAVAAGEQLRKSMGPPPEALPPGYVLLGRTVLGGGGMLSGNSARGQPAYVCYAKDCSHVDALGDAREVAEELQQRMLGRAEAAAAAAAASAAAAAAAAAAAQAAAEAEGGESCRPSAPAAAAPPPTPGTASPVTLS